MWTNLGTTNGLDSDELDGLLLVTPVQIARYHREQRYQILPAYTQDGVILARVFRGPTDSVVFEKLIEQLRTEVYPCNEQCVVLLHQTN